jgi:hypothetical protein
VGLKKDKACISGVAAKTAVELIKARADALSMTPSKFLGLLVEWWVKGGAPPLNKADGVTMQGLEHLVAEAQAAYEPGVKPPAVKKSRSGAGEDIQPATTLPALGTHAVKGETRSLSPTPAYAASRTATKRTPRAQHPAKSFG